MPKSDLVPCKWASPTVAETHAISAMPGPKLRNLLITQSYHELTCAMTRVLGSQDVSWCAYATYASKTAGAFIRGEEVPALMREYLAGADHLDASMSELNSRLASVHENAFVGHSLLTGAIERVIDDITDQVGQGNLIVFAELAPAYAHFLEVIGNEPPSAPSDTQRAAVLAQFRPGSVDEGGQDLLIQAFNLYYDQLFEPSAHVRAQRLFHANALVGYHEQIRLQGPIVGALDAPLKDVFLGSTREQLTNQVPAQHHGILHSILDRFLAPLAERVEKEWEHLSTRWLMTLTIPGATLDLGKDVPFGPDGKEFPGELMIADDPGLVAILAKLDRTPNTVVGSAANDWADLGDRMNYVVDFFRTRQQDRGLYAQPFSDEQVALIKSRKFPPGPL